MPTSARPDLFTSSSFRVEIDGVTSAAFRTVSGLAAEAEVIEYRQAGGGLAHTRKLPARVRYPNVVLERGLTTSHELWDWWKTLQDGTLQRRDVAIELVDAAGHVLLRWVLFDAWIARIEFSGLDASKNEVAIETIELAHEGLDLVS